MIQLTRVTKSYGTAAAVREVDLRVEDEQCVALIGPSGSGKSTVLRLILGLLSPDSGTVTVGRRPASQNGRAAEAERLGMGYVIQDGGLFPHLTARGNVTLVAKYLGWSADRLTSRVEALTELVGLSREQLERYPIELSGGQRQRVGLMRALMLDPPVLLLDEPLGALDPLIRKRLQDDLRRIFRQLKKTVLLVTHDMNEAAFLGDEIAIMHQGSLVQKGAPHDLVRHPATAFVAEFLQAQRSSWDERAESGSEAS